MDKKFSFLRIFQLLLIIAFFGTSVMSVLGYFGLGSHDSELVSHFRPQYLLIQLFSVGFLIALYNRKWLIPASLLIPLNLIPILPYYLPQERPPIGPTLKVMDLNVLIENRNFDKVATLIATENPDLIALEEIDAGWAAHLKNTLKTYPYKMELPQPNAFGIGLYSKIPLRDLQIHFFGKEAAARVYGSSYAATAFPSITALASIGGQAFTIVVTHPLPPLGGFKIRNAQLDDFARIRPHLQKNMILIGDLNTSSWSPYFVELTQRTGLRDSQLGFGVQPSWPSYSPLFRIPIDHILVSPKFVILSRKIGPNVGSDHLPVIVALGLTR